MEITLNNEQNITLWYRDVYQSFPKLDTLCIDIQCPKKVKGQLTIFQIIEHHTSLKDVTALKLMT